MKGLKLRYKIPIIVFFVAVILALLWFIFKIRTVTVEGNTYFSDKEVATIYQTKWWQKNTITWFVMDRVGFSTDPPYVRDTDISFPKFGEGHVKLYEKSILAGVKYANHYIYFDKDGMVLQAIEEPKEDIPYFETEDITDFTLYQTLKTGSEDLLDQMLDLAGRLTYYDIKWDTVEFDSTGYATLHSGKVDVLLGKKSDYDEQLSVLPDILEAALATKKKGTVDMSNYTPGATVIFKEK